MPGSRRRANGWSRALPPIRTERKVPSADDPSPRPGHQAWTVGLRDRGRRRLVLGWGHEPCSFRASRATSSPASLPSTRHRPHRGRCPFGSRMPGCSTRDSRIGTRRPPALPAPARSRRLAPSPAIPA
jgi:hypothetical protein